MTKPSVLITGATSGIGKAIAHRFVEGGFHVFAHARDEQRGQALIEELGDATLLLGDLLDDQTPQRIVESIISSGRQLTSLVNNAGGLFENDFARGVVEDPKSTYTVNVFVAYQLIMRCAEIDSFTSVVNVSSIHADATWGSRLPHYSAAKAALEQLTRTMAVSLAPGIRVNAVSPGRTMTSSWGEPDDATLQRFTTDTLLKRWIEPHEVADAIWFLDQNNACTGTDLLIDAGISLQGQR